MKNIFVLYLIIICFSCSNNNFDENENLNKIIVLNTSSSDMIFSVVESDKASDILTPSEINKLSLLSINIPKENKGETVISNGVYVFYYSYDTFFGPLKDGLTIKTFELNKTDIHIEINKRGWKIK